jgi:hypothetical protein
MYSSRSSTLFTFVQQHKGVRRLKKLQCYEMMHVFFLLTERADRFTRTFAKVGNRPRDDLCPYSMEAKRYQGRIFSLLISLRHEESRP